MTHSIEEQIHHLEHLLETAQNPKILWEEMQLVSQRAFDLQDQIMEQLDKAEKEEENIARVQALFQAREIVWDMMASLAVLETNLKEKTFKNQSHSKQTENTNKKCHCAHHKSEQACHSAQHHSESCCHSAGHGHCCHSAVGDDETCSQKQKRCCSHKKQV